jgi:hypothetical protein
LRPTGASNIGAISREAKDCRDRESHIQIRPLLEITFLAMSFAASLMAFANSEAADPAGSAR